MANTIDEIKAKITCVDVANMFGAAVPDGGGRVVSYRSESLSNTSIMMVSEDIFNDFGETNLLPFGDCIELYQRYKNCSKGQAVQELAEYAGVDYGLSHICIRFDNQAKLLEAAVNYCHDVALSRAEIVRYIHVDRGVSEAAFRELKLGYMPSSLKEHLCSLGFTTKEVNDSNVMMLVGRVIIPYFKNGKPVYMIGRSLDSKEKSKYFKLKKNRYNDHAIWGLDTIKRHTTIYVAEGIFDAIAIKQCGKAVVSAITGRFSAGQIDELMSIVNFADDTRLVLCMDYDPVSRAGQRFNVDLGLKLLRNGKRVEVTDWEGMANDKIDVNDMFMKNGNVDFIEKTKNFYEYFVDWHEQAGVRIKDASYIEMINLSINSKRSKSDMNMIVAAFSKVEYIPKEDVMEAIEAAKQAPSDATISDLVLADEDKCYMHGLGWFKYLENVWKPMNDSALITKVQELLGKHRTGSKSTSCQSTLKFDGQGILHGKEFNCNTDWMTFANCKYNIRTNQVAENSKHDLSTILLDYDYDKDATCPKIDKTLHQIFNNDQKCVDLFYTIAGMCLSRNTKHHMSFIFYGVGANGKSVCLDLLKAMIGKANFSVVELDKFADQRSVAPLHGKLANFASEISGNMKGAEDVFKKVAAGEEITAKLLYKDEFSFTPFSTLVFASNKFLRTTETSDGLLRRLRFLDFPMKFVDNPTAPNELRKDINLMDNLLDEIPGLFNAGMKAFKKANGEFPDGVDPIPTPDCHIYHKNKFKSSSNPIMEFYREKRFNFALHGRYRKADMYAVYGDWARANGHSVQGGQVFWHKTEEIFRVNHLQGDSFGLVDYLGTK